MPSSDPYKPGDTVTDVGFQRRIFPDDILRTISYFDSLSIEELRSFQKRIRDLQKSIVYEDATSKRNLLHFMVLVKNSGKQHVLECVWNILQHFDKSVVEQMIRQRDINDYTPLLYAIESKFIALPENIEGEEGFAGLFLMGSRVPSLHIPTHYEFQILSSLMLHDESLCLDHPERNAVTVTLKTVPSLTLIRIIFDRIKLLPGWQQRINLGNVFLEFLNICKMNSLETHYQMELWQSLPYLEYLTSFFANGLTLAQYVCCSNVCQFLKDKICMETLKALDVCLESRMVNPPYKRNQYIRLKSMLQLLTNRLTFDDFWRNRASLWPVLANKQLASSTNKLWKDNINRSSPTMNVIFDKFSVVIANASPPNISDCPVQKINFIGDFNKALAESCMTVAIFSATVDVYFVGHEKLFGPDEMYIFPVPVQVTNTHDSYIVVDKAHRTSYHQLGLTCILRDHCQPLCMLLDVFIPNTALPRKNSSDLRIKSFPVTWLPTVKIIELLKSERPFGSDIQQQIDILLKELDPAYLYNSPFQFGKRYFIHDVLFCLNASASIPIDYILSILKHFESTKFWLIQDSHKATLLQAFLKMKGSRYIASENSRDCLKLLCQDGAALLSDSSRRNALCTAIECDSPMIMIQDIIDCTKAQSTELSKQLLNPKTEGYKSPFQSFLQSSVDRMVGLQGLYPSLLSDNAHMLVNEVDEICKLLPIQHLLLNANIQGHRTTNESVISFIEQVWTDTKNELLSSKASYNIPKLEAIVHLSEFKLNTGTYISTMINLHDLETQEQQPESRNPLLAVLTGGISVVAGFLPWLVVPQIPLLTPPQPIVNPLENILSRLKEKLEAYNNIHSASWREGLEVSFTMCNIILIPASKLLVVLNPDKLMESKWIPLIQVNDNEIVQRGLTTALAALEIILIISTTWTIILGSYDNREMRISRNDIGEQKNKELFQFDFGNFRFSSEVMVLACPLYIENKLNASYDILFYSAILKNFFSCFSSQLSSHAGTSPSKDSLKSSDSGSMDELNQSTDAQQNSQVLLKRKMWNFLESSTLHCFVRAVNEYLQEIRLNPADKNDRLLQIICHIVEHCERHQVSVEGATYPLEEGVVCGLTASECVVQLNNHLRNKRLWTEFIKDQAPPLNLVFITPDNPRPFVIIRNNGVSQGPTVVLSYEEGRPYGSARFESEFQFLGGNFDDIDVNDETQRNTFFSKRFDCPL